MSEPRTIRSFDYVNHPYEAVRDALTADASAIFSNATKAAAQRASKVAAALHVNVGGVEVSTDIDIQIKDRADIDRDGAKPQRTVLLLEWAAANSPQLFPFMRAELAMYPLTSTETQIDFSGEYDPPLGALGKALDAVAGHKIAEASVHRFIHDVASYLRKELSRTA